MMYHAQHGEDRILHSYWDSEVGYYVEVGASNGIDISNTYFFEKIGWKGVLIEANPDTAEQCRTNRPESIVFNCAVVGPNNTGSVSFTIVEGNTDYSSLSVSDELVMNMGRWTGNSKTKEVTVEARTLDEILIEAGVSSIRFITIDVEGHEWGVLEGFDIKRWMPRFAIIERNQILPDKRIMSYFHRNGYRYMMTTGVNDWFCFEHTFRESTGAYLIQLGFRFYLPKLTRYTVLAVRKAASRVKRSVLGHLRSAWLIGQ